MTNGNKQRREELRRKRLAAEKRAKGQDNRQNVIKAVAAAGFLAVIAVIVVVVVAVSGGGEDDGAKSGDQIEKLLAGIPQNGTVLGNPKAKVTVVEFGDLQCGACKQFAESVIPSLVEGPVEGGDVNLEFRNLPIFEGEDSEDAARASLAASLQGRYWQFLETFYAEQQLAESGYVTDEFLRSIAEKAGVEDLDKWEAERNDPRWDKELADTEMLAAELDITGTPGIAIRDSSGALTRVGGAGQAPSLEEIEVALAKIAQ